LRVLDRAISRRTLLEAHVESADVATGAVSDGAISTDVVSTHQNVVDVMGAPAAPTSMGQVDSDQTSIGTALEISDFLSRPVPLTNFEIKYDTDLDYEVNPWDAFLSIPSIRAKFRNYAYLRGKLNVRIAVSGSPFDYGRLQVAYVPLTHATPIVDAYETLLPAYRFQELQYLSQMPGSTTINVNENEPLDLELPFICPVPMLRLFNKSVSALGAGTSLDDALSMGRLFIKTLNQVHNTSGATSSKVSVYIYMWMTEVELGCPTGTIIAITTESDERVVGPVEKIATRAANFLTTLGGVPNIGPYARASAMLASGVAAVSALFGWSSPIVNTPPHRMRPEPFQNMANVIGYDTGQLVTLDPKQELTVDPRAVGDAVDDMVIAALCSRQSLLDSFKWDVTDTPLGNSIWQSWVTPEMCINSDEMKLSNIIQPTALHFASRPFCWWRGTIKVRLEIVCSKFQRGKLAVFFEPNALQRTIIDATLDTNKQYMRIIDIQETQDVEFCIHWAQPKAWQSLSGGDGTSVNTSDPVPLGTNDYVNGYIAITPFTALQSPDDSPVYINVYVSSDDMAFNEMSSQNIPTQSWFPVEGITVEAKNLTTRTSTCVDLNPVPSSKAHIAEEYFGELPLTFRNLLHRFQTVSMTQFGDNFAGFTLNQMMVYQNVIFPVISPDVATVCQTVEPNLLNYLRGAYLGMRGSIKKRLLLWGPSLGNTSGFTVSTDPPVTVPSVPSTNWTTPSDAPFTSLNLHGTAEFVPFTNAGIEVTLPNYMNTKFCYSQLELPFCSSVTLPTDPFFSRKYMQTFTVTNVTDASFVLSDDPTTVYRSYSIEEQNATGDDFSLLRFLAAPPHEVA